MGFLFEWPSTRVMSLKQIMEHFPYCRIDEPDPHLRERKLSDLRDALQELIDLNMICRLHEKKPRDGGDNCGSSHADDLKQIFVIKEVSK